jgi:hypothetical protein
VIIHVVAWGFRDEVAADERAAVNDGLARGAAIPQARAFALSANRSPVRADGFTHAYLATFADRDALAAFQKDERHAPFGKRLVDVTSQLMVLDLECRPEDAPRDHWRGLRHLVIWSLKEGTTPDEEREVVDGLYAARVVKPTLSLAVGRCLGLSSRTWAKTHMQVTTYDGYAGLEEFRADTVLHAPSGLRLQKYTAGTTVIDIVD